MDKKHRVVILGGGFGGLAAAQKLKRAPVEVTLIDRRNFHLFQPLLYQVATGSLSPGEIAAPLRGVLSKQKNTQVLLGEAVDVDPGAKRVILRDGAAFEYDSLIVATGTQTSYYGNDSWRKWAPSLSPSKKPRPSATKFYTHSNAPSAPRRKKRRNSGLPSSLLEPAPQVSNSPGRSRRSLARHCGTIFERSIRRRRESY